MLTFADVSLYVVVVETVEVSPHICSQHALPDGPVLVVGHDGAMFDAVVIVWFSLVPLVP